METAGAPRVSLADSEAELARIAAALALSDEPSLFAVVLETGAPPARRARQASDE
jgi:hypothetical protein